MLTVFDGANGYPIPCDDYYIRELASGYNEIVFNVNIRDDIYQYIREEVKIRDRNLNEYIIKQIDAGDKTAKVVAQINLDEWKSELHMQYSNNSATVGATVLGILPQGWGLLDYSGVTKRRTVPPSDKTKDYNVTGLKILEDCTSTYNVRFKFNTKNKTITIINPASYESRGAFATRDLNLVKLNYKGKSDNFVTRLYAEGADGLTFASINQNKSYVDNHDYSDKVIAYFWKDDRYTDMQSLLDEATRKVAEMGVPTQSYDCDILDLANTNPDLYGFEDFGLFEVVTLIDDAKKIRTDYQVVERWTYPYYPAKNKVILSTSTPNIQSAIANISNSINSSTSAFQQMLQNAIINETDLITGNSGGYLVLHDTNGDGTPDELLIMNAPTIETATKVWRWNQAGLGYSDNGYNGPYTLGMTMDGQIVADLITAGTFDGSIIRAGSIDAEALSVSAKEELSVTHSFLNKNIFTDISLWEYGSAIPAPTYETIDGKTYLVIDGTGLSAWNTNAYIRTPTDITGNITISYHFKYHIDREVTVPSQRLLQVSYRKSDDTGWVVYSSLGAQTIPANTDFTWGRSWSLTDVDILKDVPKLAIYAIQGCKLYVEELTLTANLGEYTKASMDFNTNGLSLLAEELAQDETHSYLPYDVMTNTNRWKPVYNMSDVSISHEQITVDGVTKDAIVLDGTGIAQTDDWQRYRITTDLLGKGPFQITYKYKMGVDYTSPSSRNMEYIEYLTEGSSTYNQLAANNISQGQSFVADEEHSFDRLVTSPNDISSGYLSFTVSQGMKLYIYDLELTSTGEVYKSASIKLTADGLDSVVRQGSVVSQINQSAEAVKINAQRLDLTGDLDLHGTFTTDVSSEPNLAGSYAKMDASNLVFYTPQGVKMGEIGPVYNSGDIGMGIAFYDPTYTTFAQMSYSLCNFNKVYVNDEFRLQGTTPFYVLPDGEFHGEVTFYDDVLFELRATFNMPAYFNHNVYNSGGGVQFVSDRRKKRSIKDLAISKARSFIMALKPKKYKFIKDISTSDRYHHGFIAQEVHEAMPEDWGLYCENKELDFIGLRYDEIIADLVAVVQDQQKRIEELEKLIKSKEKEKRK